MGVRADAGRCAPGPVCGPCALQLRVTGAAAAAKPSRGSPQHALPSLLTRPACQPALLPASGAEGHTSTVWEVAFDPQGSRMVSCSDDATLKVWACRKDAGAGAGC